MRLKIILLLMMVASGFMACDVGRNGTQRATVIPPTPTKSLSFRKGIEEGGMIQIPAGTFIMGSDTGSDDEQPEHVVYLNEYWIDKYEITNAQYAKCVVAGKCRIPECGQYKEGERVTYPVVCVNWSQVKSYCEFVGKRLPTEAEWEKAARGTDGRTWPWGNEFDGLKLNFCDKNCDQNWANKDYDDSYGYIAPVGSYELGQSPYGVYDMGGNVWEWTLSDHKFYPPLRGYRIYNDTRNKEIIDNTKVFRGGAWDSQGDSTRVTVRWASDWKYMNTHLGGRCVR